MRFPRVIAVTWLMLAFALAPAYAEKRVALVIGNDRYTNLPPNEQLQKAVNDAHAVGAALRQIGFDVISGDNLDRRALVGRLNELTQHVAPGDVAFFFFSGHGVAIDGINYILPADIADIAAGQETLLKNEALAEQAVVSELTGRGVRVAVVVLDACRTNPFSRAGKGVGVAKGLAPPPQVQGVFSLYAAASGQAAFDRLYDGDPNPNSVFSRVLVPALTRPGVDLTALAFDVREEVARIAKQAGYEQRPAYYDETIGGRVFLAEAGNGRPSAATVSAPATPAGQQQMAVVAPELAPTVNVSREWWGDVRQPGLQTVNRVELGYIRTPRGIEGVLSFTVRGQRDRYVVHKLTGATLNAVEFNMIGHGLPPPGRNAYWCDHGMVKINELADGKLYLTGNGQHPGTHGCPQWYGTLAHKPSLVPALQQPKSEALPR